MPESVIFASSGAGERYVARLEIAVEDGRLLAVDEEYAGRHAAQDLHHTWYRQLPSGCLRMLS